MPYIPKKDRGRLNDVMSPTSAGELNYCITELCQRYLGSRQVPLRYEDFNTVVGALESAKLELYRREVVPCENKKIASEGDVYGQEDDADIYKFKP